MKKILFFTMCLAVSTWVNAQEITGVRVAEILASDDFEGNDYWSPPATLNNALGGTQTYNWSPDWGGVATLGGYSAISGDRCAQFHWGGTLVLRNFVIDPTKIYQLEVMVHPEGGISEQWNNYNAVHLFISNDANMWQQQGVRVRIANNDPAGGSPSLFAYDTWEGDNSAERSSDLLQFNNDYQTYTINDAYNQSAVNFWVPLKLVFTGAGTSEYPFIIDFYLADQFIASGRFDNMVKFGDFMIGLQKSGDSGDLGKFDNFKLSVLEEVVVTGINGIDKGDSVIETKYYTLQGIEVQQPVKGVVYIVKKTYKYQNPEVTKMVFNR